MTFDYLVFESGLGRDWQSTQNRPRENDSLGLRAHNSDDFTI